MDQRGISGGDSEGGAGKALKWSYIDILPTKGCLFIAFCTLDPKGPFPVRNVRCR